MLTYLRRRDVRGPGGRVRDRPDHGLVVRERGQLLAVRVPKLHKAVCDAEKVFRDILSVSGVLPGSVCAPGEHQNAQLKIWNIDGHPGTGLSIGADANPVILAVTDMRGEAFQTCPEYAIGFLFSRRTAAA